MTSTGRASQSQPRRRADAERNIAAILRAAREMFGRGEVPAMNDIARAAGVGRVTLYAHFASREELLDTVVERAITDTDETLTALRLDDDPPEVAVERVVRTSWHVLDTYRRLYTLALAELGPDRLRRHHNRVLRHFERLIARGQDTGTFRTDLPSDWLIASFYAVLHAAANEVNAGRLAASEVPDLLTSTVLSIIRTPHSGQARRG